MRRVDRGSWFGETVSRYVGGATWHAPWTCPFPVSGLVVLEVHPGGLVVGPSARLFRWVVPTTELAWADIVEVRRTIFGVRILRADKPGAQVVFSGHRKAILALLAWYPVTLT